HPHVDRGNICWGNAANTVGSKLVNGDIVEIFRLLWSLLTTYNPENPYQSIDKFKEIYDRRAAERKRQEERNKAYSQASSSNTASTVTVNIAASVDTDEMYDDGESTNE